MKHLVNIALFGMLGYCHATAFAAERCFEREQLVEVKSIKALPSGMLNALGTSRMGLNGIADHGQIFNKTDTVDSDLPMQRFSIAGVSADCALVAVEKGGRGYWVEVLVFERVSEVWQSRSVANLKSPPHSLAKLLSSVKK